jgi:hypothetical protein
MLTYADRKFLLSTTSYLFLSCSSTLRYVSIRQHTSAYVSIRQHTSEYANSGLIICFLIIFFFFKMSGERQVVLADEGCADHSFFLKYFFRYRARGGSCWLTRGGLIILFFLISFFLYICRARGGSCWPMRGVLIILFPIYYPFVFFRYRARGRSCWPTRAGLIF